MKLTYTLTLDDYKAAQRLHIRRSLARRISHLFWFVAIPIAATLGAIAFALFQISRITKYSAILFGIEAGLIWISLYLPFWRFYSSRKCFKQIFPPERTDRTSSIEIDDEQIISGIPGVSEGKFFWTGIIDFVQDEKISLFYIRKRAFLFFPTFAMSDVQRAELKVLVARHLPKGKP